MPSTLIEKLIFTLHKGKTVEEKIDAYNALGLWLHEVVESERKARIDKANNLPKINSTNEK